MSDNKKYFYCDMTAIPKALREQHSTITKELFGNAQSIRELPNGYAFQLQNREGLLLKAAEFIDREKLCCPFFSFALEVESEGGSVWLKLMGPEGVKPFIRAEIGIAD
jgi:hypothetical protein